MSIEILILLIIYLLFDGRIVPIALNLYLDIDSGNKKIVELLIRNGSDLNTRDTEDHTPIAYAVMNGI